MSKIGAFFKKIGHAIVANKVKSIIIGGVLAVAIVGITSISSQHTHTPLAAVIENAITETCLSGGRYDEVIYCSKCNKEIDRKTVIVSALNHTEVIDPRVEPTKNATGLTQGSHCDVCDTVLIPQETIPMLPILSSKSLTEDPENFLRGFVPAETEIFNFGEEITFLEEVYDWYVTFDQPDEMFSPYNVHLNMGQNILNIHIVFPDESIRTFTVEIWRDFACRVFFDTQGGTLIPPQYIDCGGLATEPLEPPSRAGYTFLSWDYDFSTPITRDVTIKANWMAHTNTSYRVHYCFEELTDEYLVYYPIGHTEHFTATTDSTVEVEPQTFEHFTFVSSMSTTKGTVRGDGSLVLVLYYSRQNYSLSIDNSSRNCGYITNSGSHKYGATVTSTATPEPLHAFLGWYSSDDTLLSTDETFTYTVEGDVYAKFGLREECAGFEIKKTGSSYEITGVKDKTITNVIIPYGITYIGSRAFRDCDNLTTVIISDTVKQIGSEAFESCNNLINVSIPNSVTYIGSEAFRNCNTMVSIVIPDSVTTIGSNAFTHCDSLTSVTIGNGVTYIRNGAFDSCSSLKNVYIKDLESWCNIDFSDAKSNPLFYGQKLYVDGELATHITIPNNISTIRPYLFYGYNSLTSLTIPNYTTTIGAYALYGCINLSNVSLGENVTVIESYAFYNCNSLTAVSIPNSVTTIDSYAFYNCSNLRNLHIGNGVNTIGSYSFYGCNSLTDVRIPNNVISVGSYAFYNCYQLNNLNFGNSVSTIGNSAFYNCDGLVSISFPDSVTTIGNSAFEGCNNLTNLTLGDGIIKIGSSAFRDCNNLTNVYITDLAVWCNILFSDNYAIPLYYAENLYLNEKLFTDLIVPNGVTSIDWGPFTYCNSLTSVVIPDTVLSIGNNAFYNCNGLTSVVISDSVTSIGDSAFAACYNLKSVIIGDNVISIGDSAFADCGNLADVVIGNSVTSIGDYAFADCGNLANVVIDNSVTSIGDYAFVYCGNLADVVIGNSVTSIGDYAFAYCDSLTDVVIGDSVTSIGEDAFLRCGNLTNLTLGNSVTNISYRAFYGCTNLVNLIIPDSVRSIGVGAFMKCDSLTSVVIPNNVVTLGSKAFAECLNLSSLLIGNNIMNISSEAFYNCCNLTSVTIHANITGIGSQAFYNCLKLKDVYYTGTEAEWQNITINSGNSSLTGATIHYDFVPEN